jgi:hypothetical protein
MHSLDLELNWQNVQAAVPHFTMEEHLTTHVSCQKPVLDHFMSPCPIVNVKYYVALLHDADHGGHTVKGMNCLHLSKRWDHRFESHSKAWMFVCVYSVFVLPYL